MLSSKPVAITVTTISSFNPSLITEPKIIFTSGSEAEATISAASCTSYKLKLAPPVMFMITP
ncbi:Uncharacterised protein [Streptococcus pneumoniae]|nr:Uncharacterised protein [Streptococcus pneumoniae]